MAHQAAYALFADKWDNMQEVRQAGFIDLGQVVHSGGFGDPNFIANCKNLGASAILNNGNDGNIGYSGQNLYNYYKQIASMGWHAVGGESEAADEMNEIQNNLIFYNMGGEGLNPLSNIFDRVYTGNAHHFGIASYLETYTLDHVIHMNDVVNSCIIAHNHGCREVGFLIGNWEPVEAQVYIDGAKLLEHNGVTFGGAALWAGYDSISSQLLARWRGVFQQFMNIWPPETRNIATRFAGGTTPEAPKIIPLTEQNIFHGTIYDLFD